MSVVHAPVSRAVSRIVIGGRPRRLHLLERRALLDHRLDAIADDRHHVAILDDLVLVGQIPVSGHHDRAAFALCWYTVRPRMSLSALISPCTLPPFWTSITGYCVVVNTSPATMTSARRKWTMLSPSVTAWGSQNISIASPLWNVRRRSSRYVSLGTPAAGTLRADHAILHVLMRDDRGADARVGELQREERPAHARIRSRRRSLTLPPVCSGRKLVLAMN